LRQRVTRLPRLRRDPVLVDRLRWVTQGVYLRAAREDIVAGFSPSVIAEKLKEAGSVAERVGNKIVERADALIAREHKMDTSIERAFSPHEAVMDANEKGMDDLEKRLSLLSNEDPSKPSASG